MGTRSFHNTGEPYPIPNDASEWARLDDMHNGINEYLGNKISFAPIESPQRILEIGSGSGAWAIQAAKTYPESQVIAIDISPLPPRPVPANLEYRNVNVTLPLPFEPGSFDIVHVRFVFLHLPHFRDVLTRIVDLVKPGGWLLIEDIEHQLRGDVGPGITSFYEVYHSYMKPRAVDPNVGPLLEPLLRESGVFSEVNLQRTNVPLTGKADDPAIARLGQVMQLSFSRAYQVLDPKLIEFGMTKSIHKGFYEEFQDPTRSIYVLMYFTWARKSQGLGTFHDSELITVRRLKR